MAGYGHEDARLDRARIAAPWLVLALRRPRSRRRTPTRISRQADERCAGRRRHAGGVDPESRALPRAEVDAQRRVIAMRLPSAAVGGRRLDLQRCGGTVNGARELLCAQEQVAVLTEIFARLTTVLLNA